MQEKTIHSFDYSNDFHSEEKTGPSNDEHSVLIEMQNMSSSTLSSRHYKSSLKDDIKQNHETSCAGLHHMIFILSSSRPSTVKKTHCCRSLLSSLYHRNYFYSSHTSLQINDNEERQVNYDDHRFQWRSLLVIPLYFTFEFATPLIWRAFRNGISIDDIWDLPKNCVSSLNVSKLESEWNRKMSSSKGLLLSIIKLVWVKFLFTGILKMFMDASALSGPIILKFLISYLDSDDSPILFGYTMSLCLFSVQLIQSFCNSHYQSISSQIGIKVRSAITSLIYKKALRLSNKSRQFKTTGEIVNLMAIDAQNIGEVFTFLHYIWSGIIQIVICLIALFVLIGWVVVAGVAAIICVLPIQAVLMVLINKAMRKILEFTDRRVKFINEVLRGIKIIKFFSWEGSYLKKIHGVRNIEVLFLCFLSFIQSMFMALMMGTPMLVSVCTFLLYAYVNNFLLEPSIVFPALAYFNLLRFPLTLLPFVMTMTINAKVSLGRIQEYLQLEEISKIIPGNDEDYPVKIKHAEFEWEEREEVVRSDKGESKSICIPLFRRNKEVQRIIDDNVHTKGPFKLKDISLSIPKGSLCIVVGVVGSGKSSLLRAIVGEMKQNSGHIETSGNFAYCTQEAWITNNTLRENITFRSPFSAKRYSKVIEACELGRDLKILTAGDMTEIGERGINLSGGQKQRISLSRAVYADRDIYLLDDILSAVDVHVGKSIFENCVCGLLKNKTRIFVTHQLQYLNQAEYIIVMNEGRIEEQGTYRDLMEKGGLLRKLIDEHLTSAEEGNDSREMETLFKEEIGHANTREEEEGETKQEKKDGVLIQKEEKGDHHLSFRAIWEYVWKMGGPLAILIVLALFIVGQVGLIGPDWWLSMWMGKSFSNLNDIQYLYTYACIAVGGIIVLFVRDWCWSFFALLASTRLHSAMLNRIMKAPMSFFDVTPTGRILSRFSKDQENVDKVLVMAISQFLTSLFQVVATFTLISISIPWFLIALLPISVCYISIVLLYRNANRNLKQFENVSRSPLFAHFAESLNGVSTIRAYGLDKEFELENQKKVDDNLRAYYASIIGKVWLGIRLDFLGLIIVFITTLLFVTLRESVQGAVAGLSLTYALQVTEFMSRSIRHGANAEATMNAVERLVEYSKSNVPNEKPDIIQSNRPPNIWPDKGDICFENVFMSYRPELPPVLNGINLNIYDGEKIGVVGRTGAGKSSLVLAIYRIVEVSEGKITIDGIDISGIGLTDLRDRLSIIPQEPVLFSGTIRSNLDPFNQFSDTILWQALDEANMRKTIEDMNGNLNAEVKEGGENFSVGQRQLLCLARALVKRCKILILDEATASVDFDTDAIVQRTVRQSFNHCTRITIAHRLNTIMDSDRILVMDTGKIAEFDTPKNLVLRENSILNSMINETGSENSKNLRKIALGTHESSHSEH